MGQQAVEGQVEAGELLAVGAPRLGQGAGQGGLLVEQLGGPVAHAPGLDQQHQGVGGQEVDEQVLVGGEPRQPGLHAVEDQALAEALPLLAPPRRLADQPAGPLGGPPRSGSSSRQPNSSTSARSSVERWSPTENSVSRSTSSPHRSIRTGASAVEPNTSTIEPRTASSPRCSTWYSRR